MTQENFMTIADYNKYEINPLGVIRKIKTKRIKSQYLNEAGYYMVSLTVNNKSVPQRVHRLKAMI